MENITSENRLQRQNITADIEEELRELQRDNFRVTIFGSARIRPDEDIYKQTYDLAKTIAEYDFDMVTGGGPGIMEAANSGHKSVDNGTRAYSIGIGIELPWEQRMNDYVQVQKHFRKFSRRLDQFMVLSDVVVVMPGGIGTCLELFYTWQLTQVHHIRTIPIIVVGEAWRKLIEWVDDELVGGGRVSPEDMDNVFCVDTNEEALQIILDANRDYELNQGLYAVPQPYAMD